jgi:hypothetical protein
MDLILLKYYLLSIKKGDGLAVASFRTFHSILFIPYSHSKNFYFLALLASVASLLKCSGSWIVSFSLELYARTTFGLLDILTYHVYVLLMACRKLLLHLQLHQEIDQAKANNTGAACATNYLIVMKTLDSHRRFEHIEPVHSKPVAGLC